VCTRRLSLCDHRDLPGPPCVRGMRSAQGCAASPAALGACRTCRRGEGQENARIQVRGFHEVAGLMACSATLLTPTRTSCAAAPLPAGSARRAPSRRRSAREGGYLPHM
jgi:hypothetical protein